MLAQPVAGLSSAQATAWGSAALHPPSAGCGSHPAAQSPRLCVLPPSQPGQLRGSPRLGAATVSGTSPALSWGELFPRDKPRSVPGPSSAPPRCNSAALARSIQCWGWQRSPQPPLHLPRGCCLARCGPPELSTKPGVLAPPPPPFQAPCAAIQHVPGRGLLPKAASAASPAEGRGGCTSGRGRRGGMAGC